MKRILIPALVLLLCCAPAWAQSQPQSPFNQAELDRFLKDYPAVTQFLDAQGQQSDATQPGFMEEVLQTKAFTDFVAQRGWNVERFLYVTQQVSTGMMVLQMAEHGAQIQSEYAQTRAEILKSPDLNPAQKQQFLAQMEQAMEQSKAAGDASRLAPGELALVKSNKARIYKVFGVE